MLRDLYFHILYCNGGQRVTGRFSRRIARTLPHHELLFFSNGSGSFTIRKRTYAIRPGTLLYICPDEPYSITVDEGTPVGCLTVHFSCADMAWNDGTWSAHDAATPLARRFAWQLQDVRLIERRFQSLADAWNEKLPGYAFAARTLLQELLLDLVRMENAQPQELAASLKVTQAVRLMRENLSEKLTLPALARAVHLSPAYLSRIFKEATGYTAIAYFNRLKIDRAKELLLEGDKKVREVAQALGFADEFYFSRLFKKLEGVSPSKFYSGIVHAF